MPFLLKTVSLFDILNMEYYNKGELTMDALQQIKEQICDVCHKMWQLGWVAANHGVTVYGHVGDDPITLASMLRIPVNMHNVPKERIFRPHSWAAFGTEDSRSADYRACQTYGPIYG